MKLKFSMKYKGIAFLGNIKKKNAHMQPRTRSRKIVEEKWDVIFVIFARRFLEGLGIFFYQRQIMCADVPVILQGGR